MLEDIYDEFSDGLTEPPAIRRFLRYATQQWAVPPQYVLLAGEGTYDYLNARGTGDNLVPTMLVPTPHGLQASDGWYADFDNELVPQLAIGRLPALNAAELDRLVAKVIAYENGEGGRWKQDVLLAADNPDDGGDFPGSSDHVESLTPPDYTVQRVYLSDHTLPEARALLLSAFNRGSIFVNYFGHGGLDLMASERLFDIAAANTLTNAARQPVVVSLSCAIGQFALPGFDCLSEVLMLSPGGAVAVWSPSGASYNKGANALADIFYRQVFREGEAILGDAILKALRQYEVPGLTYMKGIYNLLGDPAMKLAGVAFIRPGSTLESWQGEVFSDEELDEESFGAFDADPDGDGVPNLMEYAMGWNPHVADGDGRIMIFGPWELGIGDAIIRYQRRKSATDIDFQLQASLDLSTWEDASRFVVGANVSDDGNGVTETVEISVTLPAGSSEGNRLFVRLRVRSL